jgi:hypothetical protein
MVVETGPPDETYEDNIEYLIDTLPEFMANSEQSGNWKLFTPIGNQISELEADIQDVDQAISVQRAETIDQLEALGKMAGVSHNEGEPKEHFRSRVVAEYQLNTTEGTISDVITSASQILQVSPKNIEYKNMDTPAVVKLTIPASSVKGIDLTPAEVENILSDIMPAGYNIIGQKRGTFVYVTPTTYENTTDWSTYDGYDGLDTNDEPKGTGGTYAGLIN